MPSLGDKMIRSALLDIQFDEFLQFLELRLRRQFLILRSRWQSYGAKSGLYKEWEKNLLEPSVPRFYLMCQQCVEDTVAQHQYFF